ncbi:MAG TPA: tetratricopeptide repeat protein, partial [Rhodanobacteraceae bacterium]
RMLAQDVKPDRMARVRFKVHDLLHANKAGSNALVGYAGAAFVVAPLTTDAAALDDLVDALAPDIMPKPGNDAAAGIAQGVKLLERAGHHGGSLVLVTDTAGKAAVAAARQADSQGVRVSVLGVGGTQGTPVHLANGSLLTDAAGNIVMARRDDARLQQLARAGGGVYVAMSANDADIHALAGQLRPGHQSTQGAAGKQGQWRDMGPWLLLPLLLLGALAFRRGWLLLLPLVILPCVMPKAVAATGMPAHAASSAPTPGWRQHWSDLWHNADQRAAQALAKGNARAAEKLAATPAWRGAAAYKAGDYAAAAKAFAAAQGADAAYNLGNALARQGQYKQAIKAYDKALKMDPGLADAQANRKAVEAWLKRQKPKPPRQDGGQHSPKSGGKSGGKPNGQSGDKSGGQSGGKPGPSGASKASSQTGHKDTSGSSEKAGQSGRKTSQPTSGQAANRHAKQPQSAPAPAASAMPSPANAASTAPRPASASSIGASSAPNVAQARQERAEAARATQHLHRQLQGKTGQPAAAAFDLGRMPASAASADRLPQDMQRALERVPDDPGGLLRRKFQLQYQERRQQRGEGGS